VLTGWLLACMPTSGLEPHPAVWHEGSTVGSTVEWALVGPVSSPPPTGLMADVGATRDGVVLVGDAVQTLGLAAWERVGTRWREQAVLPLRGRSEREQDPRGRRFEALWEGASPWGRLDVGEHRVVWLDPADPVDQRFWLPGAVARAEGGVVAMLPYGSAEVEQQLLEAVPASALALVVRGDAEGNRARLPQGRWGYLELAVGPVSGGVLEPVVGAEGFHGAHRAVLEAELPASSWALRPEATLRDALAPGGWWRVQVGEGIAVELRRRGNDGQYMTSYRADWTRDGGWVEAGGP
jgi:hypothetical protein